MLLPVRRLMALAVTWRVIVVLVSTSLTSNLQPEAATDLNRLRALIERMVAQAKTISSERKAYDSLSLLEDVLGLRLALAKDAEDQASWSSEYSGVREVLASSQTQVASLGAMPVLSPRKSVTTSTHHASATSVEIRRSCPAASRIKSRQ